MLGRMEMAKDAAELQKALEENPYFLGPMFHLSSLQQHWNMLDWDGVSFRAVDGSAMCCGDRQREKMLGKESTTTCFRTRLADTTLRGNFSWKLLK